MKIYPLIIKLWINLNNVWIFFNITFDIKIKIWSKFDFTRKSLNLKEFSKKILVDISKSNFLAISNYFKNQRPNYEITEFIDEKFPPIQNSFAWVEPEGEVERDLTDEEKITISSFNLWVRVRDIFKHNDFTLFEKFDIEDINQGEIGNCYFLSTISAIAEYGDRYKEIFISKNKSENGCYEIRLLVNGVPKIIVLDDYFPVKKNKISFYLAHSKQKEIWVNLLEKAWAKINGSYASTIAGLPSEAFGVLTEAPCFSFSNRKYTQDEMWKIISNADREQYIICTNSKGDVPEMTGIVRGHAYTIVSAYEFKNIRLLKLRNPWGSYEWSGDYSDKSDKWDEELRNFVNFKNQDDGIFFMKIEDFLNYFPYTFICKYKNNYFYEYKKFQQSDRDSFVACKFTVRDNTHAVFTLHQKQQRFFRKIKNYKATYGSIILAKYDKSKNPNYEYYSSDCSNQEKIHFEIDKLDSGEYHVFANLNWQYSSFPCKYTISCYSAKEIKFENLTLDDIPNNYILQILNSFIKKTKEINQLNSSSNIESVDNTENGYDIDYSLNNNHTGFFIMRFSNFRSSEFLQVNLEIKKNDKLYLCKLNLDGFVSLDETQDEDSSTFSKYELLVGKNSNQIIAWKLLDHPSKVDFKVVSCTTCFCDQIPENFKFQKDMILKFIEENIDNTQGQELEEKLFLKELEYYESIMFVLINKNNNHNFKIKLQFHDLVNLCIDRESNKLLFIKSQSQDYCFLKKFNSAMKIDYKLSYSLKTYWFYLSTTISILFNF